MEFNRERTLAMLMLRSPESSLEMWRAWAIAHIDYSVAYKEETQAVEMDERHRLKMNNLLMVIEAWKVEKFSV